MLNGGDLLARGAKTAQFAGAGSTLSDFESDFIFKEVAEVCEKYGISQAEFDQYSAMRLNNEKLPDLKPVADQEVLDGGFSVTDHRKNYLNLPTDSKKVEDEEKKYPEYVYAQAQPILDRILVMIVSDNPDEVLLEDGSTQNKKTSLITAAKYRQHSNKGIVLATGKYVVLSGTRFDMSEFILPGDKITYGDYNSEIFPMDRKKVEEYCDALQVNYVEDPKGLRVVRVQDVRVVERRLFSCADVVLASSASLTPTPALYDTGDFLGFGNTITSVMNEDSPSGCEVYNG